jgi:hypothetical protein
MRNTAIIYVKRVSRPDGTAQPFPNAHMRCLNRLKLRDAYAPSGSGEPLHMASDYSGQLATGAFIHPRNSGVSFATSQSFEGEDLVPRAPSYWAFSSADDGCQCSSFKTSAALGPTFGSASSAASLGTAIFPMLASASEA